MIVVVPSHSQFSSTSAAWAHWTRYRRVAGTLFLYGNAFAVKLYTHQQISNYLLWTPGEKTPVGCDFWAHVAASYHFPRTSRRPIHFLPRDSHRQYPPALCVKKIARKFDTVLNFVHSTARVCVFTESVRAAPQHLKIICLENMQFARCVVR
jgi:hypothetical protein